MVGKGKISSTPSSGKYSANVKAEGRHFSAGSPRYRGNNAHLPTHSRGLQMHNCMDDRPTKKRSSSLPPRPATRRHPNELPEYVKRQQRSRSLECNSDVFCNRNNNTKKSLQKGKKSRDSSKSSGKGKKKQTKKNAKGPVLDGNQNRDETSAQSNSSEEPLEVKVMRTERPQDHEYLHFLLRITEDILRNDLYTNREMKKVFTSHFNANKSRLNGAKMLEQIQELMKELNMSADTDDDDGASHSWTELQRVMKSLVCICQSTSGILTEDEARWCSCGKLLRDKEECPVCKQKGQIKKEETVEITPQIRTNPWRTSSEKEMNLHNYDEMQERVLASKRPIVPPIPITSTSSLENSGHNSLGRLTEYTEPLTSTATVRISEENLPPSCSTFGQIDELPGFENLKTPTQQQEKKFTQDRCSSPIQLSTCKFTADKECMTKGLLDSCAIQPDFCAKFQMSSKEGEKCCSVATETNQRENEKYVLVQGPIYLPVSFIDEHPNLITSVNIQPTYSEYHERVEKIRHNNSANIQHKTKGADKIGTPVVDETLQEKLLEDDYDIMPMKDSSTDPHNSTLLMDDTYRIQGKTADQLSTGFPMDEFFPSKEIQTTDDLSKWKNADKSDVIEKPIYLMEVSPSSSILKSTFPKGASTKQAELYKKRASFDLSSKRFSDEILNFDIEMEYRERGGLDIFPSHISESIKKDCEARSLEKMHVKSLTSEVQEKSLSIELQDKSLSSELQDKSLSSELQDKSLGSELQDKSLSSELQDKSLSSELQDKSLNSEMQGTSFSNDLSTKKNSLTQSEDPKNYHQPQMADFKGSQDSYDIDDDLKEIVSYSYRSESKSSLLEHQTDNDFDSKDDNEDETLKRWKSERSSRRLTDDESVIMLGSSNTFIMELKQQLSSTTKTEKYAKPVKSKTIQQPPVNKFPEGYSGESSEESIYRQDETRISIFTEYPAMIKAMEEKEKRSMDKKTTKHEKDLSEEKIYETVAGRSLDEKICDQIVVDIDKYLNDDGDLESDISSEVSLIKKKVRTKKNLKKEKELPDNHSEAPSKEEKLPKRKLSIMGTPQCLTYDGTASNEYITSKPSTKAVELLKLNRSKLEDEEIPTTKSAASVDSKGQKEYIVKPKTFSETFKMHEHSVKGIRLKEKTSTLETLQKVNMLAGSIDDANIDDHYEESSLLEVPLLKNLMEMDNEEEEVLESSQYSDLLSQHPEFLPELDKRPPLKVSPSQEQQINIITAKLEQFRHTNERDEDQVAGTLNEIMQQLKERTPDMKAKVSDYKMIDEHRRPTPIQLMEPIDSDTYTCCGPKKHRLSKTLSKPQYMNETTGHPPTSLDEYRRKSLKFEKRMANMTTSIDSDEPGTSTRFLNPEKDSKASLEKFRQTIQASAKVFQDVSSLTIPKDSMTRWNQ